VDVFRNIKYLAKAQRREENRDQILRVRFFRRKNKKTLTVTENELSKVILDVAFEVYNTLGPGLFESVDEEIMAYELINKYDLQIQRQKNIPVIWKEVKLDLGFRSDLIIEDQVIVELKSVETVAPVHPKQLLTHLKLTGIKSGLLINFNEALLKDGIKRIVNNL
jgi:GxxExxY protein